MPQRFAFHISTVRAGPFCHVPTEDSAVSHVNNGTGEKALQNVLPVDVDPSRRAAAIEVNLKASDASRLGFAPTQGRLRFCIAGHGRVRCVDTHTHTQAKVCRCARNSSICANGSAANPDAPSSFMA